MSVAQNLKALMDARGWTPERLAVASQEAGEPLTVAAINQWLSGRNGLNQRSTVALAKALKCTTDEILIGDNLKAAV